MNGIAWKGFTLSSILLSFVGPTIAAEPAIEANEAACRRERLAIPVIGLEFCVSELPFRLVSHQCIGDRCFVVEEEATCGESKEHATQSMTFATEDRDAILQSNAEPPMSSLLLGRSLAALGKVPQPIPSATPQFTTQLEMTELRIDNVELRTRLELTQTILELHKGYIEQILALQRENARLTAESSVLRTMNEVNEQLTASLIERTELTAKLAAAHEWIGRRTPVPFAVSTTNAHEHIDVPRDQLLKAEAKASREITLTQEELDSPCREANAAPSRAR